MHTPKINSITCPDVNGLAIFIINIQYCILFWMFFLATAVGDGWGFLLLLDLHMKYMITVRYIMQRIFIFIFILLKEIYFT